VQSALLECYAGKQVTLGYHLADEPFLVLATTNPIEQEGTIHYGSAVDRFMLKVVIGYPTKEEERHIIRPEPSTGRLCKDQSGG